MVYHNYKLLTTCAFFDKLNRLFFTILDHIMDRLIVTIDREARKLSEAPSLSASSRAVQFPFSHVGKAGEHYQGAGSRGEGETVRFPVAAGIVGQAGGGGRTNQIIVAG